MDNQKIHMTEHIENHPDQINQEHLEVTDVEAITVSLDEVADQAEVAKVAAEAKAEGGEEEKKEGEDSPKDDEEIK